MARASRGADARAGSAVVRDRIGAARRLVGPWHPLHRRERIEPFFIVGAGRSGTTLLRRILVAGGEVHIPPELQSLPRIIETYRRFAYLPWRMLVLHAVAEIAFHPRAADLQVDLGPFARTLMSLPVERRSLAAILDAFYRFHAAARGEPSRWGDKTPLLTFHLDQVRAVFPRARVVHVVRDPYDVVASGLRAGLFPDAASGAVRWRDAIAAARQFSARHPTRIRTIRYEALVREPAAVVPPLCAFLDLRYDPRMLDSTGTAARMADVQRIEYFARVREPISAAFIGEGRTELSMVDLDVVSDICGETMRRLGYAPAR